MDYNDMISNVEVYGLSESIRGAKLPMCVDLNKLNGELTNGIKMLAQSEKGEGHDQWLTGVTVQFDLKATNKMWVEAERYRFLYFVSSQSTMHRITRFNLDEQYISYTDIHTINIIKEKVKMYNYLQELIANESSKKRKDKEWIEDLTKCCKDLYLEILYSNPAGFQLTARLTTNYRELKTIYAQRKTHRLPEWRAFCDWVKTLPNSELITGD